jgi:hypothetical protein
VIDLLDDRAVALAKRIDAVAPGNAKRNDQLVAAWEKMHP